MVLDNLKNYTKARRQRIDVHICDSPTPVRFTFEGVPPLITPFGAGFFEKLSQMVNASLTEEIFEYNFFAAARRAKAYGDHNNSLVGVQNAETLLRRTETTYVKIVKPFEEFTFKKMCTFMEAFSHNGLTQAVVSGNIHKEDALGLFATAELSFPWRKASALPPISEYIPPPKGSTSLLVKDNNPSHKESRLYVIYALGEGIKRRILGDIGVRALSAPHTAFFTPVRGYESIFPGVSLFSKDEVNVLIFRLRAKSPPSTAPLSDFDSFVGEFVASLNSLTGSDYQNYAQKERESDLPPSAKAMQGHEHILENMSLNRGVFHNYLEKRKVIDSMSWSFFVAELTWLLAGNAPRLNAHSVKEDLYEATKQELEARLEKKLDDAMFLSVKEYQAAQVQTQSARRLLAN